MHEVIATVLTFLLGFALAGPVEAAGLLPGEGRVALGEYHSCALTAFGGVVCWGENGEGQLGGGGSTPQTGIPVPVTGLSSGVAAISAHHNFTCALTTGGGVLCWGDNSDGQLGNGTTVTRPLA